MEVDPQVLQMIQTLGRIEGLLGANTSRLDKLNGWTAVHESEDDKRFKNIEDALLTQRVLTDERAKELTNRTRWIIVAVGAASASAGPVLHYLSRLMVGR